MPASVRCTETPLTLAAMALSNPQPMMQALVGGGAHLDFRNSHALTAIHRAALNCNRESIKVCYFSSAVWTSFAVQRHLTISYEIKPGKISVRLAWYTTPAV